MRDHKVLKTLTRDATRPGPDPTHTIRKGDDERRSFVLSLEGTQYVNLFVSSARSHAFTFFPQAAPRSACYTRTPMQPGLPEIIKEPPRIKICSCFLHGEDLEIQGPVAAIDDLQDAPYNLPLHPGSACTFNL